MNKDLLDYYTKRIAEEIKEDIESTEIDAETISKYTNQENKLDGYTEEEKKRPISTGVWEEGYRTLSEETKTAVGEVENLKEQVEKNYVKFTDIANPISDKAGLVKIRPDVLYGGFCVDENGYLMFVEPSYEEIEWGSGNMAITTRNVDEAVNIVGSKYFATKEQVGDFDAALDAATALCDSFIGGETE